MTFIKLTRSDDDTTFFVNVQNVVGFQVGAGATDVTLVTENVIRVKQTVQDIIMEIDRLEMRK